MYNKKKKKKKKKRKLWDFIDSSFHTQHAGAHAPAPNNSKMLKISKHNWKEEG